MIYKYNHTTFNRVIDGDTLSLDIDLGFGLIKADVHIRIEGVDCPENRGEESKAGKIVTQLVEMLIDRLKRYKDFHIEFISTDKPKYFNRAIGSVFFEWRNGSVDLGQWLLANNLAIPYVGQGLRDKTEIIKSIINITDLNQFLDDSYLQ